MVPMVTTTGDSVRLAFRLTTVWRPEMTRADVVIGSTVFHGMPPCPCFPVTVISRVSLLAVVGPLR